MSGAYGGTENLETLRDARNYNAWLAGLVLEALPASGRLLDFGAGIGVFAESVRGAGREVEAVEPEPVHARRLGEVGLTCHPSLKVLPSGVFSGAYTLNVLEHIEDDVAALQEVRRVLRPGAPLLVYVPALPILFSAMDRRVGHHRRYRMGGLRSALEAAGFTVASIRYADVLGVPAALVYRLVGPTDGSLNPVGVRLYDRLLFPVSRRVDRLTSRLLGKNLIAIARAP